MCIYYALAVEKLKNPPKNYITKPSENTEHPSNINLVSSPSPPGWMMNTILWQLMCLIVSESPSI